MGPNLSQKRPRSKALVIATEHFPGISMTSLWLATWLLKCQTWGKYATSEPNNQQWILNIALVLWLKPKNATWQLQYQQWRLTLSVVLRVKPRYTVSGWRSNLALAWLLWGFWGANFLDEKHFSPKNCATRNCNFLQMCDYIAHWFFKTHPRVSFC